MHKRSWGVNSQYLLPELILITIGSLFISHISKRSSLFPSDCFNFNILNRIFNFDIVKSPSNLAL